MKRVDNAWAAAAGGGSLEEVVVKRSKVIRHEESVGNSV